MAIVWARNGPAQNEVKSATRTPSSGSPGRHLVRRVAPAPRPDRSTRSPSAGAAADLGRRRGSAGACGTGPSAGGTHRRGSPRRSRTRRTDPSPGSTRRCRPRSPARATARRARRSPPCVRSAAHASITGLSSSAALVRLTTACSVGSSAQSWRPIIEQKSSQCCRRLTTAKPTKPSRVGTTSATVAFARRGRTPATIVSIVIGLNSWVMITDSSALTSTNPPGPPSARWRRASWLATAANTPAMYSPCCPPAVTGGHAREPRRTGPPDSACSVSSVAGRSAHGPVVPNGGDGDDERGTGRARSSRPTGAPGDHSTASAVRSGSTRSAGSATTMLDWPPASQRNSAPSPPSGIVDPDALHRRSQCPSGGSARVTPNPPALSSRAA